jgi:hypothetical protein
MFTRSTITLKGSIVSGVEGALVIGLSSFEDVVVVAVSVVVVGAVVVVGGGGATQSGR